MKLILVVWLLSASICLAQVLPKFGFKGQGMEMAVSTRKAEQLSAFYAARGLPQSAIGIITQYCFITVGIYNNRSDTLWLELDNWRVIDNEGNVIPRITRKDWEAHWQQLGVPAAYRATFGWTLLPEVRDLLPHEPVGGNIAIAPPATAFSLYANFSTGDKKTGPRIAVKIPNLQCEPRTL